MYTIMDLINFKFIFRESDDETFMTPVWPMYAPVHYRATPPYPLE